MCHVNLADDEAFRDNIDLLEPHQIENYNAAFSSYKRSGVNAVKYRDRYYDNALFVIYSQLPYSQKFCRCGMKGFTGRRGVCTKRLFCTACAYSKFAQVYDRFRDAYSAGTYYSVTFSFDFPALQWEDRNEAEHYWEAADYALEKLIRAKKVDGAVLSREMSIRGFAPLRIHPHAHAVVLCDQFQGAFDMEQEIHDYMAEYQQSHVDNPRRPNVEVVVIEDVDEFENKFHYLFKPIDIKSQYEVASTLGNHSAETFQTINNEVRDFVQWIGANNTMRKLLRCKGSMNSGSKRFVGKKTKDLRRQRPRMTVPLNRNSCRTVLAH